MMKALLVPALLLTASTACAQTQIKIKGDVLVVKDKSKPVRRALEQQYAIIMQANIDKDFTALLATRTPDFSVKTAGGETWNYDQSANYSRRAFEQVQSTILLTNEIGTIELNGSEAAAEIHQHWVRLQMKGGKLRRIDTSTIQRETWINTPAGWRMKMIDDIHPGAWFVDGQRVDPSKPYDPGAPAFVPDPKDPQ